VPDGPVAYQELIAATAGRDHRDGHLPRGSAHYLATMCELVGHGEVVSIDVNPWSDRPGLATTACSTSRVERGRAMLADVRGWWAEEQRPGHPRQRPFPVPCPGGASPLPAVRPGGWLIVVEDTNVNGTPRFRDHGPDLGAVDAFLNENRTS